MHPVQNFAPGAFLLMGGAFLLKGRGAFLLKGGAFLLKRH